MSNNFSLANIYTWHHQQHRKEGFVLLGNERGNFLSQKIGEEKKVLDIGCRDGSLTKYFTLNNEVWGADIDAHALNVAQKNLGIKVKQMDLNGDWEDLPENYFDAVVAAEVLEHLYFPDLVVKKIVNVLKPGGCFFGSVPFAYSFQNRLRFLLGRKHNTPLADPTHINHFTYHELVEILDNNFYKFHIHPIISKKFNLLSKLHPYIFAYSLLFEAIKAE